jgi:hypothetical protein
MNLELNKPDARVMRMKFIVPLSLIIIVVTGLVSCQQNGTTTTPSRNAASKPAPAPLTATAPQASPFILSATIQDIMISIIDPAADYLWNSVSIIGTADGIEEHQPRTDEEWLEVRHKAITLMEAANLLAIPGRHVVGEGKHLEDEGVEGNLTAAEIQKLIDDDHASFTALAHALNTTAGQALQAIEQRDVDAFLDAGGAIDTACEGCHTIYWYPNQVIPDIQ